MSTSSVLSLTLLAACGGVEAGPDAAAPDSSAPDGPVSTIDSAAGIRCPGGMAGIPGGSYEMLNKYLQL